ncbi:MAG: NapC/NirT family cytochrome c [Chloroflexi bacterium]|nr:NapC/NirT family cytochrome c [Chloroflexota bacterium]
MEPREQRRRHRDKLLFLMLAGAISIILLVIGSYQLVEFTDSTAFCGRLCHQVMYPEYTAYQASPHSRVRCTECHVGPGADYLVKSKLAGVPLIFATISDSYSRPIPTPVENLRPARETCEQCHRPEKFAGDLVRVHTSYAPDETNTEKIDVRVLRVGGGESEVARDIHWHIAAQVWYLALDSKRQEIGWVGVENTGGELVEYVDPQKADEVTPERVAAEKRLMDCIDCHNRATHIFRSPAELVDTALAQGKIDKSLPFIKRESMKALDPPSASLDQASDRVKAIGDFYRANYPQVYEEKAQTIAQMVLELKEVARLTTFPEMKVTWKSYPINIGHQEAPGCFRCHGKLAATAGEQKGQPIDVSCNLCHYFALEQTGLFPTQK